MKDVSASALALLSRHTGPKTGAGEQDEVGKRFQEITVQKGVSNVQNEFGFFVMATSALVNKDSDQQRQINRAHVEELKVSNKNNAFFML